MKALNKISILDCDEAQHEKHMKEIENIWMGYTKLDRKNKLI